VEAPTPIRPAEEVVGAFVPITLGGKEFRLRELPRRANREWKELLTVEVRKSIANAGPLETVDQVIDAIAASAELMMDLLIAYDQFGTAWPGHQTVLPEREWIDSHATDRECYESMKKVTAVAFPFGADLLTLIPEIRPLLLEAVTKGVAAATVAMTYSRSTSSAPPSTAGTQSTSRPA
jgi:hypothetical protein